MSVARVVDWIFDCFNSTSGINKDYATAYGSLGYEGGSAYFRGLVINGTGYHYGDKVYDSRFTRVWLRKGI